MYCWGIKDDTLIKITSYSGVETDLSYIEFQKYIDKSYASTSHIQITYDFDILQNYITYKIIISGKG